MNLATAHDIQYKLDQLTRHKTAVMIHPADVGMVTVRLHRNGETATSDVLVLHEALAQAEARLEQAIELHKV